jgi:hypothetical protein
VTSTRSDKGHLRLDPDSDWNRRRRAVSLESQPVRATRVVGERRGNESRGSAPTEIVDGKDERSTQLVREPFETERL